MSIFLFLVFHAFLFPVETLALDDALDRGLVKVNVTAFTDTVEYKMNLGRNLKLELTSIDRPLLIELIPGTLFVSEDSGVQNQILSERRVLTLEPGKTHSIPLFTLCTQKYNAAPTEGDPFRINGMASSEMSALADFLSEREYYNNTGQAAMWMLTDHAPYQNIVGQDEKTVNEIRKFMATLTKNRIPEYRPGTIERGPELRTLIMVFRVRLKKRGTGKLVLYDPDAAVCRVLKEEGEMLAGRYEIRFKVESTRLQPGNYTAVLYRNGMAIQQEIYRVR